MRFLLFVWILIPVSLFSQESGVITGVVSEAESGETLFGANVLISPSRGTTTDLDGKFEIQAAYGSYELEISYIGYQTIRKKVELNQAEARVDVDLPQIVMREVQVVADIAIDRETPVAFSNVDVETIEEELASREIPMILNSTPGVYATNQGGGDGDARITIRGFDQSNVAVMVDGVPVNDMENGWVYWSNWFGLDGVTKTVQVQRGLGASKLALPSIGGTMNILTKGLSSKSNASVKQEFGNNGMMRTTIGVTSGRLKGDWGISAGGSYKKGNGWVDGNYTKAGFYYLRIDKQFGDKHTLSAWGYGAPQQHGQRSSREPIMTYDKAYAAGLFKGSEQEYREMTIYNQAYSQLQSGQINQSTFDAEVAGLSLIDQSKYDEYMDTGDFIDTTRQAGSQAFDYGLRYNPNAGTLKKLGESEAEDFNSTINKFHKPQINLRHLWQPNEAFFLATTAYVSLGNGGGTRMMGIDIAIDGETGISDYQTYYDANHSETRDGEAKNVLSRSVNNHKWYGALSTFNWQANDVLTFSGGLDLRYYTGTHYSEVFDIWGGEYFIDPNNNNQNEAKGQKKLYEGDKYFRHYDGQVQWGGAFGMLEYKKGPISTFLNLSTALSRYRRVNYFAKKDLLIDGERIPNAVGYGDTLVIGGQSYTINSKEAQASTTPWENLPGFTIKAGASYNINEYHNIFFNAGYLNKAPAYVFVFDADPIRNRVAKSFKNEVVRAFEAGYSFRSNFFSANVNGYFTNWVNKPTAFNLPDPEDPDLRERIILPEIKALHTGFEIDFAVEPHRTVTIEGLFSFGDWTWRGSNEFVHTFASGSTDTISFDADGVHVGDAAQLQLSGMVRYEPIKGLYIKPRITWFGKNYANFAPNTLQGVNAQRESWQLPNYYQLDISAGYKRKVGKQLYLAARINLFNVTNLTYISDAQNNGTSFQNFDARSATVYFGQGFRWTVGLELSFSDFIKRKEQP